MISNVGLAVFIFGNKIDPKTKKVIDADGMQEEFEIAIKNNAVPIPIGATGFTSKQLWQEVMDNFNSYVGIEELKPLYLILGNENKTPEELIEIVIKIINRLTKN